MKGQVAFDITDEEQWRTVSQTQHGQMTDHLFIERMEALAASLLGAERNRRFKVPACFEGSAISIPPMRRFEHDFPFENGRQKYTPAAIKHYSREADFERIHRSEAGVGIQIRHTDAFQFVIDWLQESTTGEMNISIVEEAGEKPNYFIYMVEFNGNGRLPLPPLVCDKEKLNFYLFIIHDIFSEAPEKPTIYFVSHMGVGWEDSFNPFPDGLINVIPDAACRTLSRVPRPSALRLNFFIYCRGIWSGIFAKDRGVMKVYDIAFQQAAESAGESCYLLYILSQRQILSPVYRLNDRFVIRIICEADGTTDSKRRPYGQSRNQI